MRKHHLSKKLFFAGLVLFIIGAIGVAITIKSGTMIEKGEPLTKQWDLSAENINTIAFSSERDVLIEWKESTTGKNYIELKGNYSANDKKAIQKLEPVSEDGTSFNITVPEEDDWYNNFGKIYAYGQQKVTVFLTKDTKLADLQVKSHSGDIDVSDFKVKKFVSSTNSGELKVNNLEANSAQMATSSGDLDLSNIKANTSIETGSGKTELTSLTGDLEVNGGSGDVNATGVKAKKLKIAIDSGDIELTNGTVTDLAVLTTSSGDIDANTKGKVQAESDSGAIELAGVTNNVTAKTSSGDIDVAFNKQVENIEVNTDSGEVELKLPGDFKAIYETKSNSGSIKAPTSDSNTANRVTVKTSSGDITIEK
ncbi:DUF4097 family beta strand repeat-containing protein [Listeria innocua]|uniref:DUF4097 family beta strand repeat-containing protein n=1 Tax=Listeria innocua TaxID=1642 RepID=UPI000FAF7D4B|nr:DUF4097 domain-containing protein [Listeria innocua]UPG76486.1 DUF4097 domain-containing protein [Listeria innocua]